MSTDRPKSDAPDLPDEAKVHDLLPPDEEEWAPPMKKIAERRVGGWQTSIRLFERRAFRPAGNSRRFWRKVEDDDPFLPKAPGRRMAQEGREVYAADRLVRMPDAPRVERPTEQAPPQPKPRRVAPPPERAQQRPEPTYTEEPTPAPRPRSVPRPPPQAEPEAPPIDRRPPRVAHQPKSNAGRIRVGRANAPPKETKVVDRSGRSATEVREEREKWREEAKGPKAPPKLRGYDDVLSILGDLQASKALYDQGIKGTENADVVDTPRPKPKAVASPPRPQPEAAPPPLDRTPPKPKAKQPKAKPPVNRSPSGGSSGGLDDLFGGGPQEGRMRIPRRSTKKPGEEVDEEE